MTRVLGIALILLGLAGLAWGGLAWNQKNNVDLGPIEMQVTERKTLPIPPIAGAVAVMAGLALAVGSRARQDES